MLEVMKLVIKRELLLIQNHAPDYISLGVLVGQLLRD